LVDGNGVQAAANAVIGGAATAMSTLVDGGRLATITSDPPTADRAITVTNLYVRSDGRQLTRLATLFGRRELAMPSPRRCAVDDAAAALTQVAAGQARDGIVIVP
jgi:hypothetical protein